MSQAIILALLSLAGNVTVAAAFTFMDRAHTKERKFLVNAALSGNTYEFAVRQAASADVKPQPDSDLPDFQYPEGL